MSRQHLLASYIMRVTVHSGERSIALHDIRTGEMQQFSSYEALLQYLDQHEHSLAEAWLGQPRQKPP